MRRLDPARTPDRSFLDFIETRPGGRKLVKQRAMALEYVQGFHAADPALISERALADGGSPGDDPNEKRMARVLDGYDRVPQWLSTSVRDSIRRRAAVSHIAWRPGMVRLTWNAQSNQRATLTAKTVIVTVPLGVLLAAPGDHGAITFDPPVTRLLSQARGMTMGSVQRIALSFTEAFWENDKRFPVAEGESLGGMSFLHTRDPDLPVWWTTAPVRSAVLVGWAGGPRAARLQMLPPEALEQRALNALARQFGVRLRTLRGLLRHSWSHNWSQDPFARGAYSYILVHGDQAPSHLSRPLQKTLFFAGEAADPDGRLGTVHGAIASGIRAAAAALRALRQ